MTVIKEGNWSFKDPGKNIPDGSTIDSGNFCQVAPGTKILSGKKLIINGGNWVNVEPDPNWTINSGNWAQIEFCSHERPELVKRGLKVCLDDCIHRSEEKNEREISEEEFRKKNIESKKMNSSTEKSDLTINKSVDSDGITVQTFKIQEYTYRSRVVKTGPQLFRDINIGKENIK